MIKTATKLATARFLTTLWHTSVAQQFHKKGAPAQKQWNVKFILAVQFRVSNQKPVISPNNVMILLSVVSVLTQVK